LFSLCSSSMQMRLYASHGENDSLHRSSGTGLKQVQEAPDDCHSQLPSCNQIHGLESSSSDAGEYVPPELQYVGPVECDSLENFIWWSQLKQHYPHMPSLTTFQDSKEVAPLSHQLLASLAISGPQGLLGIRQWPCDGMGEQSVTLHIECVAAGTEPGSSSANRMRTQIMRLLAKEFSRKYIPGPALAGRNLRAHTDAPMPLNLDNSIPANCTPRRGREASHRGSRTLRAWPRLWLPALLCHCTGTEGRGAGQQLCPGIV
jgi:hypothetical protein